MSFYSNVSNVFPGVEWTGSSGIHVSVYRSGSLAYPASQRAEILAALKAQDIGGSIFDFLSNSMPSFEWLLEREVFANLFLIDVDLRLRGLPTSISPDRVQNPATGNLFHRIAIKAPYVGSVRFWADGWSSGVVIGFRFRIVKLLSDDEEVDVRAEAREREAQIILDLESVEETIMDVAEPPVEAVSAANNILSVFS